MLPDYTVTGYTADADVWCPACLPYDPEGVDAEGNPVTPIFADSEFDCPQYCCACGAALEVTVIGEEEEEE